VAALIAERVNIFFGVCVWPILLILGFISVWLWYSSEAKGMSDLRLYVGLQVFALFVTVILCMTPSPYDRAWNLWIVILLFGLARLFEVYDHPIDQLSGRMVSGHTLKHLADGTAGIWLIYMLAKRKIKIESIS
jgi:hypothetical protein